MTSRPVILALLIPNPCTTSHTAWAYFLLGHLFTQPLVDALGSMALLARRVLILVQQLLNEQQHLGNQPRTFATHLLAFRWYRILDGFPHHPPVYAQFLGYTQNRSDTLEVLAPDLLE